MINHLSGVLLSHPRGAVHCLTQRGRSRSIAGMAHALAGGIERRRQVVVRDLRRRFRLRLPVLALAVAGGDPVVDGAAGNPEIVCPPPAWGARPAMTIAVFDVFA